MRGVAFFDFDGTITRSDSFLQFLFYANPPSTVLKGLILLSPTLLGYFIGLLPNWKAKQKIFSYFFKDQSEKVFIKKGKTFAQAILPGLVKPSALEKIRWHQNQKHTVVLVSASLEPYLSDWCKQQNMALIGTRIEIKDGKITGAFQTPNCYGPEKVNRIKELYNLSEYDTIYAYGDSNGDREMLEIAHHPFYRVFRS